MSKPSGPVVIVVDGIIAGGKSTYINMLASRLTERGWKVTIVKEPVDEWNRKGPNGEPSFFELYNADKSRWSYHFQTKAFLDRVQENESQFQKHGATSQIFLLERFCSTDRIFMNSLYEEGYVTDMELAHYKQWADRWQRVMPYTPDLFIYLDTPIDACMNRIPERNRSGEEGITRTYQETLKRHHDAFFAGDAVKISEGDDKMVPCVRISTVENYRDDEDVQKKFADHFELLIVDIMATKGVENVLRSLQIGF